MNYRHTKSGLKFSELGAGCMNLPLDSGGEEILDLAIDNGINYFDTADLYQKGANEAFLGNYFSKRGNRSEIMIGSKVGNEFNSSNDDVKWNPSKQHIMESVKESLRRLKTDYLDLYMLHGGMIEDNKDETIEAFTILKNDGLIRAYGISSIRPNVIDYYLDHSEIDVIMMQFNLLDNRPEMLLEKIKANHVQLLARGPIMKGLLTQHYESVADKKFQDGLFTYDQAALKETLQAAQNKSELTPAAFKYLLDAPVASIIAGCSKTSQLKENITAYESAIDARDLRPLFKNLNYEEHLS